MALAITVPTQIEVGDTIVVTATGATHSGDLTLEVYADEGDGGIAITSLALVADGSGNVTTAGVADFCANVNGHINYKLTDVTAVASVEARTEVFLVN